MSCSNVSLQHPSRSLLSPRPLPFLPSYLSIPSLTLLFTAPLLARACLAYSPLLSSPLSSYDILSSLLLTCIGAYAAATPTSIAIPPALSMLWGPHVRPHISPQTLVRRAPAGPARAGRLG